MSCNGCRVLRRGCSGSCVLRPCLDWIESPQAQANATLFVAKFFGRSDLIALISAVPDSRKPALFHSLLYEACGRTVNPVNGAFGLLSSGNWHVCQSAVETVLNGGTPGPVFTGILAPFDNPDAFRTGTSGIPNQCFRVKQSMHGPDRVIGNRISETVTLAAKSRMTSDGKGLRPENWRMKTVSVNSEVSETTTSLGCCDGGAGNGGGEEPKLLNLFV